MKTKLLLMLVMMMICAGCVGDQLVIFDPATGKPTLKISRLAAMGNWRTRGFALRAKNKNAAVTIYVADSNQTDSPESAKEILNGLANLESAGAAGAVNNLIDIDDK